MSVRFADEAVQDRISAIDNLHYQPLLQVYFYADYTFGEANTKQHRVITLKLFSNNDICMHNYTHKIIKNYEVEQILNLLF